MTAMACGFVLWVLVNASGTYSQFPGDSFDTAKECRETAEKSVKQSRDGKATYTYTCLPAGMRP